MNPFLVCPGRVERPTLTFGGLRSIQLSYRHMVLSSRVELEQVSLLESESSAYTNSAMTAIIYLRNYRCFP